MTRELLVLVHGLGADGADLAPLAPLLGDNFVAAAPDGPYPYGPGRCWFRMDAEMRPQLEDVPAALTALALFVAEAQKRAALPPERTVLCGFSQGAAMVYELMRSRARAPARAAVIFSGFLAPGDTAAFRGRRFFVAHGTYDPLLPPRLAADATAALRAAGADVTSHDYPIGHEISEQEIADARAFLTLSSAA